MSRSPLPLLAAGWILLSAGCAGPSRPSFRWPVYEDGIVRLGEGGGQADPAEEARILSEEVERASGEGAVVPPGVRAHLGWLYLRSGNGAGARQMLAAEREAYPESGVFVDWLLAKVGP